MASFELKYLVDGDASRWDDFVESTPTASLYHRYEWLRVIREVFRHEALPLAAVASDGGILGILPLIHMRSRVFGHFVISVPCFNYGGALAIDGDVTLALMDKAAQDAMVLGASHLELRNREELACSWPVRTDKVSMHRPLPAAEDELWSQLGSKLRAQVRRPAKEGAVIKVGQEELLDDFYAVFARNMRDLGTPVYPRVFFNRILAEFRSMSEVVVVYLEDSPVAAGLTLHYKGVTEVPWASSLREANRVGVNMGLYWEMLRRAVSKGCHTFDFGRSSKDSGTYRFKRQWGAAPRQLHWYYWLSSGTEVPRLNPSNPKYQLAISAWQRLPLPVANWLGPKIVRNLP